MNMTEDVGNNNVKDTAKYSIFKRETHAELYQTSKMELL